MTEKPTKFKQTEIGKIPEDWEVKKLLQFCDILMGQSPPSNTYNTNDKGLPFFQGRKDFGLKYPIKAMWCSEPTRVAKSGDILLSVRAPIGDVNVAIEDCCIGRGLAALSMKNGEKEFLYYLLVYNQQKLKQMFESEGTVFGCVTKEGLKNFEVILPAKDTEQRAIAKILSDLDAKIELNQQMNKTLEAIGQALFKHWFIDFEFPNDEGKPYKSSGGEMVDSELGEIPKEWNVEELGEYIKFIKGRKPNEVFDNEGDGLVPQILIDVLDGGTPFFSSSENMVISNKTDIIMIMDGASSGRTERGFSGILGSTLAKIQVKELNQDYVYYLLKRKEEDIKVNTTGTSIPHADKKKIEKYLIVVPPKKILKNFQIYVNNILFKQILIRKENNNLSQIRDLLLPKLMTGKIRVPLEGKE